jgi:type IV pilus assembly protein PilM
VTAAIVRGGVLLLHRSVDLQPHEYVPVQSPAVERAAPVLPLVDVEATAGEWAAQEPLPEHGRNPYADRVGGEQAVQDFDGVTGLPVPPAYVEGQEQVGVSDLQPVPLAGEIAQAVSVAAAYFEDTLAIAPVQVFSAGPLGAEKLGHILVSHGVGDADGLRVRELVEVSALLPDAVTVSTPRAWLSGVVGALRG